MEQKNNQDKSLEDMGFTIIDMGTDRLGDPLHWNIQRETGYEPKTTFWQDFALADIFGPLHVAETVARTAEQWKSDAVYITELSMVLNHRGWMHYHAKRKAFADLYFAAWEWLVDKITTEWLTGDDLTYFYETTD